jgi:hypothetical protein
VSIATPSQTARHVPLPGQALREPWGASAGAIATHAPTCPATSHAAHWAPHADSQQTPSTQNPEPHSLAEVHAAAFGLLHEPCLPGTSHRSPAAQAALPQQTPSTQLPVTHARHEATRQSAPAAELHAAPCALRARQTPPGAQ